MAGFCWIVGSRAVVMWTHGRTSWRSTATVALLVVCVSRVSVDAVSYSVDDDRPTTERHQRRTASGHHRLEPSQSGGGVSNCASVHQFVAQTMQYSNELPMTKRHAHPPLEVCVPPGDSRSTARHSSCCTRTLERHLHQSAMDDTRQAIAAASVFRRLQATVAKTTDVQGL